MRNIVMGLLGTVLCIGIIAGSIIYITNNQKKQGSQDNSPIPLSEELLQGIWVNEDGFVCEYENKVFTDSKAISYTECIISEDGIEGSDAKSSNKEKVIIQVIDESTIEINNVKAFKQTSEKGKVYSSSIQQKMLGDWLPADTSGSKYCITEDAISMDDFMNHNSTIDYEYDSTKVILPSEKSIVIYIQTKGDELTLLSNGDVLILYRKDSQTYKDFISNQSKILNGDWFLTCDNKIIEKWEITDESINCIAYESDEKAKKKSYELISKNPYFLLMMEENNYSGYMSDDIIMLVDENDTTYYLKECDSVKVKE